MVALEDVLCDSFACRLHDLSFLILKKFVQKVRPIHPDLGKILGERLSHIPVEVEEESFSNPIRVEVDTCLLLLAQKLKAATPDRLRLVPLRHIRRQTFKFVSGRLQLHQHVDPSEQDRLRPNLDHVHAFLLELGLVSFYENAFAKKQVKHISCVDLDVLRPIEDVVQNQRDYFLLDVVWVVLKYVLCVVEHVGLLDGVVLFKQQNSDTLLLGQPLLNCEYCHLFVGLNATKHKLAKGCKSNLLFEAAGIHLFRPSLTTTS